MKNGQEVKQLFFETKQRLKQYEVTAEDLEEIPSRLMPYQDVRKLFSDARKLQLETQGPITDESIQELQKSRKYADSSKNRS